MHDPPTHVAPTLRAHTLSPTFPHSEDQHLFKNPTQFYITRQNKNKPWGPKLRNEISIFHVKTPELVIHTGSHFISLEEEEKLQSGVIPVLFLFGGDFFATWRFFKRNEMNMKIL
jgi:hypothetical protein